MDSTECREIVLRGRERKSLEGTGGGNVLQSGAQTAKMLEKTCSQTQAEYLGGKEPEELLVPTGSRIKKENKNKIERKKRKKQIQGFERLKNKK